MQISKYGLVFTSITGDDLETVRIWRNSEAIKSRMVFRETITSEKQLLWFKNLKKDCNYYFIVSYNQQRIGLMNIKDINWESRAAEPGGFVVDEIYLGTYIPALCLLVLFDFAFMSLGLSTLQGKVLRSNPASLDCNLSLGGVADSYEGEICYVSHSKENYIRASEKYRIAAKILYNEPAPELHIQ